MDSSILDWLTDRVLEALARDEPPGAAALQLLLRRFSATGRADLAEPLGAALARELDRQAGRGCDEDCAGWLVLFAEAAAVSDDARLARAAADLLPAVRRGWADPAVDVAMRSIDASLLSIDVAAEAGLAAAAIDALERVVAGAYRPGQGISHAVAGAPFARGGSGDHVQAASALLTAYTLAGRLPYAMLADELMQSVLRTPVQAEVPFAVECDAARVFCRLAALHRHEAYRRTAVLPIGADYGESARRTLAALTAAARAQGAGAALFGLALAEWLDLK